MAGTGDKTFSSRGRAAAPRRTFEAVPVGDYEMQIKGSKWEVKKKEGSGTLPYASGPVELLNTASEGGKNRLMFLRLWTCITPKDGQEFAAIDGQDQVVAMARAMGEEFEGVGIIRNVTQTYNDKASKKDISRKVDILDAKSLLRWVQAHDGLVFKAHVKRKKRHDGEGFENEVDYFIAAETEEAPAEGEEGETFEETEAQEGGEVAEGEASEEQVEEAEAEMEEASAEAEVQEEEEAPAPPPKKAAAKAAGPAKSAVKVVRRR